MPIIALFLLIAAALGSGILVMRLSGIYQHMSGFERSSFAFAIGIGIVGWLIFFVGLLGLLSVPVISTLLIICAVPTIIELKGIGLPARLTNLSRLSFTLIFVLLVIFAMDLAEALSPLGDADTLAYHFATPQRFIEHGALFAIPRAYDGAIPLLVHMTYTATLLLGGETGAMLWTMVSGWALVGLVYVVIRQFTTQTWALFGAALTASTPIMVYAAGTGQIEARSALFALAAVAAASRAIHSPNASGWLIYAGLSAGFFAGSKITGLIFVFALFTALWLNNRDFRPKLIFVSFAIIAGCQWYLFNWQQTGDPLFPMLWQYLDLKPGYQWGAQNVASAQAMFANENLQPRSLGWFFSYPVRTIISPLPIFESLRTGLGPATVLGLPFLIIAAWNQRRTVLSSPLIMFVFVALVFYSVWFFFGPSLRVRHLFPIYPLCLIIILVGCARFSEAFGAHRSLIVGFLVVLMTQFGGHVIFSKKYIEYLATEETRASFLERNVSGYKALNWLNTHLPPHSRTIVTSREWLYLLTAPYLYANPGTQVRLTLHQGNTNLDRFLAEIRDEQITHLVLLDSDVTENSMSNLGSFVRRMIAAECASKITSVTGTRFASRTIPSASSNLQIYNVYSLDAKSCRIK